MFRRSQLFTRAPRWRLPYSGPWRAMPPAANSWILESGSLTARLKRQCGSGFGVRLLRQSWDKPFPDESRALDLPLRRHVVIREVLLHCRGVPLIAARSIIPPEALLGVQCRLAQLGERSLGELLFSYRQLSRESLEWTCVEVLQWHQSLAKDAAISEGVWGRRSVYQVARGSILVGEFFLPRLVSLPLSL